jgi:hypothetical protein
MRSIYPCIPSTPVVQRCIMTWKCNFGGLEWSMKHLAMWYNATPIKGSWQIIWHLLDCCSRWTSQPRSGKTSTWTSFWACLQVLFHLGDCWSIYQVCPLHSNTYLLQDKEICNVVHWAHFVPAWCAKYYHLWPRGPVCCPFIGATSWLLGNLSDSQFSIWSTNRWSDG